MLTYADVCSDEENVQAPPDSAEEISDVGTVERWHNDISINSDDDTPSGRMHHL
jgi:hypothetical protein